MHSFSVYVQITCKNLVQSASLPSVFQVGERIRVILDCDDNTLAFEKNYEFLGVAFRGRVWVEVVTDLGISGIGHLLFADPAASYHSVVTLEYYHW